MNNCDFKTCCMDGDLVTAHGNPIEGEAALRIGYG